MIYQPTRRDLIKYGSLGVGAAYLEQQAKAQSVFRWQNVSTQAPATPTLISSVVAGSTNATDVTSGAIDTTGATLLVGFTAWFLMTGFGSFTDSKGNTWTSVRASDNSGNCWAQMFYVASPTVGTGHTFTVTAAAPPVVVMAFSGITLTSPLDVSSSHTNGQTTPVTPNQNGSLLVAAVGDQATVTGMSIDTGFSAPIFFTWRGGMNFGGSMSYFVQTTAAMIGPNFTSTPIDGSQGPSFLVAFKPA